MATLNLNENSFEQQNKEMKILKVGIRRFKFLCQRNKVSQEQQIREYQKRMMQHKKTSKNRLNVLKYQMPCHFDESKQIQKEIEKISLHYLKDNSDLGIEDINSKFIGLNLEEQNKKVFKVLGFINKNNTLDLQNQIQEEN
ncbi:unnamed protein product [Paramecium pentaurelia]|uniref:Uncharacterized protein n=1 Tax=Paramecium pentaurelia TaxID=43138 RepID=A0A8S1V4E9_9CILI|nr:unnamed protein product [Paramecium pentaurelia]